MSSNGNGGSWKNTAIGILSSVIVVGIVAWWSLAAGPNSYASERGQLLDTAERLVRLMEQAQMDVTKLKIDISAHDSALREINRRLDKMEKQ